MSEAESPPNPFWDYALALYAAPGVEQACIGLQDRRGADVNLLLFCCWAGHRSQFLSAAELDRMLAASQAWQAQVVGPLRQVRRDLKQGDWASPAVAALREEIKALERQAERIEQDRLLVCVPLGAGALSEDAIAANLALYIDRLSGPIEDADQAALACLRASAAGREAQ